MIRHTTDLNLLPPKFFIFSYGANNIENIARRCFGDPYEEPFPEEIRMVENYTYRWVLHNYKRVFFSHSDRWGGSVATIHTSPEDQVSGILTHIQHISKGKQKLYSSMDNVVVNKISDDERNFYIGNKEISLENLFHIESVNEEMYCFKYIDDVISTPVYSFVGSLKEEYKNILPPSQKYLDAISKTLEDNKRLPTIQNTY